jgi:hypothetical protein
MSENFQHPKENNKNLQPPREKTKIQPLEEQQHEPSTFKIKNKSLQFSKLFK